MTNEEKLYQIFPDGVCPFSRVWLSEEYQEPTTNNDLGVDCISRADALNCLKATELKKFDWIIDAREKISNLPSVTPQEQRCKDCKWWKDSDGEYRRGCGAESQCPINRKEVFEGNGYCYMYEPQESEDKE